MKIAYILAIPMCLLKNLFKRICLCVYNTYIHTYIHTYVRMYRTYIHTHRHTRTHIHTHTHRYLSKITPFFLTHSNGTAFLRLSFHKQSSCHIYVRLLVCTGYKSPVTGKG
jgi:hypothetical protein